MSDNFHRRKSSFATSWGALYDKGGVRFRLWDAGGTDARLRLDGRDLDLQRSGDGWAERIVEGVRPGTPYSYVLGNGMVVPDPASRAQQAGVHGPSLVVDPGAYEWQNTGWKARPWEETVHYELHIGTFTPEGTFRAAKEKLQHIKDIGVTAIEIMPVGQWEGNRGWGYDGVLMYAPHSAYGTPDDMKAFIDAAHGMGLNVMLDVIYNHFGPDGNYLAAYAPDFFHEERHTPWGAAIAYEKKPVRDFFIENALYWLEEFNLDGLRLDAVDHIDDEDSDTHLLVDLAQTVRARFPNRPIHLTTEDNRNITSLHERGDNGTVPLYTGEWNDDFHNVAHVIATGETEGYYVDFKDKQFYKIARTLAEGFAFQGEAYKMRDGQPRGKPSGHLPPTVFVDFLQNHDQVGNRAFGERLIDMSESSMVQTLMAMLLLSPHIPLLFMGEEYGETRPFTFFTDFHGELADAVREGRRREFAHFSAFHNDEASLKQVPDPNDPGTFNASKLDWACIETEHGQFWLDLTRRLLAIRADKIVPLLYSVEPNCGSFTSTSEGLVWVQWKLTGGTLRMVANLDDEPRSAPNVGGETIYATSDEVAAHLAADGELPGHSIVVAIEHDHQALVRTN